MHALEMESEQVQNFVGSGRKKTQQSDDDLLAMVATKKGFLAKVVAGACVALLVVIIVSAKGDVAFESVEQVGKPASPTSPTVQTPTHPPKELTTPAATPASTPAATPAATPAPVKSVTPASTGSSGGKEGGKDDGNFVYSKLSTFHPLPDHDLPDENAKQELSAKWGHWHFWDGDEDVRPTNDYMAKYPNRDIPGDDFPEDAWQTDAVFVNHYLNDADQLIARAMEAIFSEYGHGKPLQPEQMAERMKMFHWSKEDLSTAAGPPQKYTKRGDRGNGGWTTKRSFDGLVRRLLHAMMTSDTFTVVMGGHSAAAGQGNHFRQSYMMQFHKIMYPIFARLGVKLVTRNFGQGGMGTIQNSMGSGSIYGNEIDLLLWDSGMTEGGSTEHIDLFLRQGLLGGNRVPVVWGGNWDLLKMLHEEAEVDVGEWGLATDGIVELETEEQAKDSPYASYGMKCKEEVQHLCNDEPRFCANCWIDRDDGIKPEVGQREHPRGQVKWHPGWRSHQLTGRNIAFAVLQGLQVAVNQWTEGVMGGPPLDEDMWHVTDYYENIRSKVKNLGTDLGACHKIEGSLPARMCNTPMKAKTQYTPRADYHETSLTSIIKPTSDGYVPKNQKKALYEGPDAHNPCFDLPDGAIDVFNIVAGRRRLDALEYSEPIEPNDVGNYNTHSSIAHNRSLEEVVPGKGWQVFGEPQGYCDGTYSAVCARQGDIDCALYGHHDERGAVVGNEFSGWLVMTLKDLKEGIVVIKMHTWHYDSENTVTQGWASVNNVPERRRLGEQRNEVYHDMPWEMDASPQNNELDESGERMLMRSYDTPNLPDTFVFEYAIDGKITTLTRDQFLDQKKQIQRVVETLTLLDDPSFTSDAKDVEVAVRLKGCGRACTFGVSHIYWA